jgi:hypothetical protein
VPRILSGHAATSDPVKLVVDDWDEQVECRGVALSPCDEESRDIGWRGCDGRILLLDLVRRRSESGPESSIIREQS